MKDLSVIDSKEENEENEEKQENNKKDETEEKEDGWLNVTVKWMHPRTNVLVTLFSLPTPRDVTLSQVRPLILRAAAATTPDFYALVVRPNIQMQFVYKGRILEEEETDDTLLHICGGGAVSPITLFVVLTNAPEPPTPPPPRVPLPVNDNRVAPSAAASPRVRPVHNNRSNPTTNRNRNTTSSNGILDPWMDQLQEQFPEHDIRDLVQTLLSHPDARAQMERSFDLQLAQLDHLPGGMNLLQSLYSQQQDQEDRFLSGGGNDDARRAHPDTTSAAQQADAAVAGATGQAMPNPWRRSAAMAPRRPMSRQPPPSFTRPMPRLPVSWPSIPPLPTSRRPPTTIPPSPPNNPWTHEDPSWAEQLYEAPTAITNTTATSTTDHPPMDDDAASNDAQEQLLFDMGFTNRSQNRSLLRQHNWDTTVDILLQQQQQQQQNETEDSAIPE